MAAGVIAEGDPMNLKTSRTTSISCRGRDKNVGVETAVERLGMVA
jgi:hypothetical protein